MGHAVYGDSRAYGAVAALADTTSWRTCHVAEPLAPKISEAGEEQNSQRMKWVRQVVTGGGRVTHPDTN